MSKATILQPRGVDGRIRVNMDARENNSTAVQPAGNCGAPARVALSLLALGLILTAARIHGYSFSAWHAVLDGSQPVEVLLNAPRAYRSDDWLVTLPHCLAQRAAEPAFPAANPLIGDGHYNMIISGPAPARDLTTLFRPQTWGYFISADTGLAWQWWFGALGLWLTAWLLLLRLTGNDHWTAACGATALLFSPFCQAWSLNCAPSLIFACGVLLAGLRLQAAGTVPRIIASGAILAWTGTGFLLTFNYTPYLVTLFYFMVFVFTGAVLTRPQPDINGAKIRSPTPCPSQEGIPPRRIRCGGKTPTGETNEFPSLEGPGVGSTAGLSAIAGGSASGGNLASFSPDALPRPYFHWPIGIRRACALAAILAVIGLGAYVAASNWDTIQTVRHSDYPGQRIANGGSQTIWHLFRGNVLTFKPPPDWGDLNPCEGAGFFMLFPLVCAAFARDWWRTRRVPAPLIFALAAYLACLLIWNLAGFPEILARWTLLARAPPSRTLIGLGGADLLLLAGYAAGRSWKQPALRRDRFSPWIVGLLWAGFHVGFAFKLASVFPGYQLSAGLIGGIFSAALAPLLYLAPRLVLPAIMAASILGTYDLNPVARGGTAFIRENALSQKILALDREGGRQGRRPIWIAYGDMHLPNLCRMLGAKALNGVHAYPQLELWRKLDPAGHSRSVYNRYAHIVFDLPAAADEVRFDLVQPDLFVVYLHPAHPGFAALQADYILGLDHQTATFDRLPMLTKVYSFAGKHIYRVRQERRSH